MAVDLPSSASGEARRCLVKASGAIAPSGGIIQEVLRLELSESGVT